jgi:hypothetical protein
MCSSEISILFYIDKHLQNIKGTGIVGLAALVGLRALWGSVAHTVKFSRPGLFSHETGF